MKDDGKEKWKRKAKEITKNEGMNKTMKIFKRLNILLKNEEKKNEDLKID